MKRLLSLFVSLLVLCAVPGYAAPPVMPRVFDKPTVQKLIDNIEERGNAPVLKVGYFTVYRRHDLPMEEGLELLQSAIEKETEGSRRWFLLQQVYAYGAIRIDADTQTDGLKLYEKMFGQGVLAKKAAAEDVLMRSVYEYVNAFPTVFLANNGKGTATMRTVLAKALKLYLNALKTNQSIASVPNWTGAMAALSSKDGEEKPFLSQINEATKAPAAGNRKRVLETAAAVYAPFNKKRANEYLRQAKALK